MKRTFAKYPKARKITAAEACDNITASTVSDDFEIGDIVEIYTSMDGWFGEYEVIREAEPADYVRLSQYYMQDYPGTKYLLKSIEPSFVDETIETSQTMRKIHKVEACDKVINGIEDGFISFTLLSICLDFLSAIFVTVHVFII